MHSFYQISWVAIIQGGNWLNENFSTWESPVWKFFGRQFSRLEFSWVGVVRVGVIRLGVFRVGIVQVGLLLGGNFLWWKLSGGNHPGGNFAGGSFHVTHFLSQTIHRWRKRLFSMFGQGDNSCGIWSHKGKSRSQNIQRLSTRFSSIKS